MDEVGVLRAVRSFIERGWIQGNYAKTADGTACNIWSEEACSWCLLGAINAAYFLTDLKTHSWVTFKISTLTTIGIATWNDTPGRSQQEVLDLLDKAITLAEKGSGL